MRFFCYIFVLLILASCGPRRVVYNYLSDIKDTSFRKGVFIAEPVIQKNDLLSIKITSASLDPATDVPYNLTATSQASGLAQEPGYLVDVRGNIEIPRIGLIKAEGLTKDELSKTVRAKLKDVLTQPSVVIRFLNFRVTVLGEVRNAGVLSVPTERLSILEAVGMAGGITEFGTIKNVRVLREIDGQRETGVLDLTAGNIFESKYYQLRQNDVILVDQTDYKLQLGEQQRRIQQLTLGLTILTSLGLLYSIIVRR
ncbi:polysaccharide biosynthesis/export family protein [Flaviaesturariibacter amylovorans]|uniref:Polysaccharide export protein n=1 Tax=Flaviaesturariibacter amylovorans TaxID=1084520 RepID=A0ABP8GBM4_9BACT